MIHFRSKAEIADLEFYDDPRFRGYSYADIPPNTHLNDPITKIKMGDLPSLIGAFDVGSSLGLEQLRFKFHYDSYGPTRYGPPEYFTDYHPEIGDVIPPYVSAQHYYHFYRDRYEVKASHDFPKDKFLLLVPVFGVVKKTPPLPPDKIFDYHTFPVTYFKTYDNKAAREGDFTLLVTDVGKTALQVDDETAQYELVEIGKEAVFPLPEVKPQWKRISPVLKRKADLSATFGSEMFEDRGDYGATIMFLNTAYASGKWTNADYVSGDLTLRTFAWALPDTVTPAASAYLDKLERKDEAGKFIPFPGGFIGALVNDPNVNNPIHVTGGTNKPYSRKHAPLNPWPSTWPLRPDIKTTDGTPVHGWHLDFGIWNGLDVKPNPRLLTFEGNPVFTPENAGMEGRVPQDASPLADPHTPAEMFPPLLQAGEYTSPFPASKVGPYYPHMTYEQQLARGGTDNPLEYAMLDTFGHWDTIPHYRDLVGPNEDWRFYRINTGALISGIYLDDPVTPTVALGGMSVNVEDEAVWNSSGPPQNKGDDNYPHPIEWDVCSEVKFDTGKPVATYKRDSFLS